MKNDGKWYEIALSKIKWRSHLEQFYLTFNLYITFANNLRSVLNTDMLYYNCTKVIIRRIYFYNHLQIMNYKHVCFSCPLHPLLQEEFWTNIVIRTVQMLSDGTIEIVRPWRGNVYRHKQKRCSLVVFQVWQYVTLIVRRPVTENTVWDTIYNLTYITDSPWAKTQIFTYRYHLGGQNLVMFFMYTYAQCII